MQPIHLSYTPDRADFTALYALERTPAMLRIVFFAGVVAMSSGLGWLNDHSILFAALNAWSPPWGEVVTILLMVVIMYGVLIVLRDLARALRAAQAATTAARIALDADDDGIWVATAGRADPHPWRDVRAAWLRGDRVFITLPGGHRLALPRRAFADAAAMRAFASQAEDRLRIASDRGDAAVVRSAASEAVS